MSRAATGPARRRWTPAQRKWLVAIVLLAALLRGAWVVHAARPPQIGDPVSYSYFGEQMARGHGYHSFVGALAKAGVDVGLDTPAPRGDPPPSAFYPIGYPGTLALVFWVVLHTPIPDELPEAVGWFQAALGVLTVLMVAELGRALLSRRAGLVAAGLVAVFPNLVYFTASANQETVLIFLTAAALLIAARGSFGPGRWSWGRVLAFGAVLGLSGLVKPTTLIIIPALVVAWLVGRVGWRRALLQGAVAAAAFGAVLAPWVLRNAIRMDAAVVSTGIGDALCIGHRADSSGAFEVAADDCLVGYEDLPFDRQEVERNRDNTRKAIRFALNHPVDELRLLWPKAYYGYRNDHDAIIAIDPDPARPYFGEGERRAYVWLGDTYYYVVGVLAVVGLVLLAVRRSPRGLLLVLSTLGLGSLPLALFGDPRYHVLVLPLLALLAAVPLSRLGGGDAEERRART